MGFRILKNDEEIRQFANSMELFAYQPGTAYWFSRHPHSTYMQYDDRGAHWRVERLPESSTAPLSEEK